MTTTKAGIIGQAPTVLIQPSKPKKSKTKQELYRDKCWGGNASEAYRRYAPGEHLADLFLETAEPKSGVTVIDWGCGTGRGGKAIHDKTDLDVTLIDFAENCLDTEVRAAVEASERLHFDVEDLTQPSKHTSLYGFCTDVLEHIEEQDIPAVLSNILMSSEHVFFQISTLPSGFSHHHDIDEELHVCIHDYYWWLQKFVDQTVVIERSSRLEGSVLFYVTGWGTKNIDLTHGTVNTDQERIIANIRENSKLKLQQMRPYDVSEDEVMLLCGGPTLNDFEDEIKAHRANGVKLITTNGSYNWCLERGLKPSLQCIVDARDFNKRFTVQNELTKETKYAIATQCDPSIFEGLPLERSYFWNVSLADEEIAVTKECFGTMYEAGMEDADWFPVPGGSTVGLRTLCLLMMIGYRKVYVYGMDSCVFEDRHHHAYEQVENDDVQGGLIPMITGAGTKYRKTFQCQPWQAVQAKEFEGMASRFRHCQLQIKGDGLIAELVNVQAKVIDDERVAEIKELIHES